MDEYLCINDVFTAEQKRGFENLPVKGETYTLKEEVKSTIDNKIGLAFYELPNPSDLLKPEAPIRLAVKWEEVTSLIDQNEIKHTIIDYDDNGIIFLWTGQ
jgi:hypothetical protein